MPITLAEQIDNLIEKYGGLRAAAANIGLEAGYLSRLHSGARINPSDDTLVKLGLVKTVIYEPAPPPAKKKAKRTTSVDI